MLKKLLNVSADALSKLVQFDEIIVLDTEFEIPVGGRPNPICLCAKGLRSRKEYRIFRGDFKRRLPFKTDSSTLLVAFYSSAEWGSFRALGLPMPERVLDLYCEFRNRMNGLKTPAGYGLEGALAYFRITDIVFGEKTEMQRALGEGTWRGRYSREEILDYCAKDCEALERLLPLMLPEIDLPRALLRGRYMIAASAMEWNGTPIDVSTLELLRARWDGIKDRLILDIDKDYGVFRGHELAPDLWAGWLARNGVPWPKREDGRLELNDDVFRQMAKAYPAVSPIRELKDSLSNMRLWDLAVGQDARNRCLMSAFRSKTGRNQPSNTKFIFGPNVWLRGLIKPPVGHGVAYVDWVTQEFAIAAALSGDEMMMRAYLSGDVYLAFGKQAGLIPPDGTQETHGPARELCKQCILGVQYGMGAEGLALRIDQPVIVARNLLRLHRETYKKFWKWSDGVVDSAMINSVIRARFGWTQYIGGDWTNPRSLRNFPMQANGAEMMRVAACLATERGVEVCAPIHDAFLICSPLGRLELDIAKMRQAMAEASRAVLGGFEIRTDCPEFDKEGKLEKFPHVIRYPNRYMDKRGVVMWERVMALLGRGAR